jgi:RNA polymerase sigma-70 factor (ECF subfamily)
MPSLETVDLPAEGINKTTLMLSQVKKESHNNETPLNSLKDDDLVRLAQNDDPGAMEELVQRYQRQAFSIAYHMAAGDLEEAKDHTQEAFLRVFRNIKRFKLKSTFYTWFYRIIVNTCLDGRRRRRRREKYLPFLRPRTDGKRTSMEVIEEQVDMGKQNDPLAALSDKKFRYETRKAMRSLSENQRLTFQLKVLQEMSIHEIAQVTGMAEGTIKSHLFRATQVLRKALQDWVEP